MFDLAVNDEIDTAGSRFFSRLLNTLDLSTAHDPSIS